MYLKRLKNIHSKVQVCVSDWRSPGSASAWELQQLTLCCYTDHCCRTTGSHCLACLHGYQLLLLSPHHWMTTHCWQKSIADVRPLYCFTSGKCNRDVLKWMWSHSASHLWYQNGLCLRIPDVWVGGLSRHPLTVLPVAGEDLLRHLDGDVALLSPLVQIQQVSSEARGWLEHSACREVEMDNEEGQGESD